jgi:hypothetical protein
MRSTCLLVAAVAGCLVACNATVSISATRNPSLQGPLEPFAFVVYQRNTGPNYTTALVNGLERELKRREISGRALVITGAEYNEDQILHSLTNTYHGIGLIVPVGGTSYDGSLKQILYDVRVLEPSDLEAGQGRIVWRARVNTSSGGFQFQIDDRLSRFAEDLVTMLVADRVLPADARPPK